jgi:hypothetical protein
VSCTRTFEELAIDGGVGYNETAPVVEEENAVIVDFDFVD